MSDKVMNPAPRKSSAWPIAAVCITLMLVVGVPMAYVAVRTVNAPERLLNSFTSAAAEALRPKINVDTVVLNSVTDLHKENKLAVMSAEVNTDVTVNESASYWGVYWGTNTARVSVHNARVQYVIDTGSVGTSDYRYDDKNHTLLVTFPHPRVDTSLVAIDPAKIYTMDLRGGWARWDKGETRDHAIAELRPQVITQAQAPHLLELADIRGQEAVTKLLEPLSQTLTRENITLRIAYRD